MNLTHLAAALALTAATALPAAAQAPVSEPGTWTVTPFLSLSFGGDGDSTSLGLGGAAGYDITPAIGVEAELGYTFDLAGNTETDDWSLFTAGANVLYHFPLENGMAPYATAGLGLARSARTRLGSDTISSGSSTEVGFNLGGGLKAPLTDRLAARGDIRYFSYNDDAPDGFRLYGGLTWRIRR